MIAPNIVLLMSDQHRADMTGCYGDPVVRTPAIDALAASGTRFRNVSCQGPICMPARASLLTERYVRDHGVFDNRDTVPFELPTFLGPLKEAGYHNAVIGKTHLWLHTATGHVRDMHPAMHQYGFDEVDETVGKLAALRWETSYSEHLRSRGLLDPYNEHMEARNYHNLQEGDGDSRTQRMWDATPMPLPPEDFVDAWHGQRTADWIDARTDDTPFFLMVGFPGPHDPWDAPTPAVDRYRDAEIPMPATLRRPDAYPDSAYGLFLSFMKRLSDSDTMTPDAIREVRRAYYASISIIDDAVERIVSALARRGILDDTWILYTSDHGEMMGDHSMLSKVVFYESSVRVPLIIRPPGGMPARVVDDLIEHIDLSATIRRIAGAPELPGSNARSLLGYVDDREPTRARDCMVTENFGFAAFETGRYTLVVDEGAGTPVAFFDRLEDPNQDHDRIADPEAKPVIGELMETRVRPFLAEGLVTRHRFPFHTAHERGARV